MKLQGAWIVFVILLGGCSNAPTGKPFSIVNSIKDISFEPQHEEAHCSKACMTDVVPDTWFILFCNVADASDCITEKIRHAPWGWECVGQQVDITWQPRTYGQTIEKIIDQDGHEVTL